jgi:isoaspartyl peptidase/L-asparaginase-like protein (Ntn-hydrolase superfamily)
MYDSPHCALSADGALQFAQSQNFPTCCPEELISPHALQIDDTRSQEYVSYHHKGKPVEASTKDTYDTVSAVAMDVNGNLACATSTGRRRVELFKHVFFITWKPCYIVIK